MKTNGELLRKCIFNITASSLKCYEGYKGNMPGRREVNFKETSCSPIADVCFKESFKTADGYFATVKSCHTSLAPEFLALRIKPDDCMVGFEDYCRRKTGLSRQAIARENNITNMISRSGARDFLAQQCKKIGTSAANQGNELAACLCTGDLCNSASNLNHWVTSILVTLCILFVI